jgi:hypothetical protein
VTPLALEDPRWAELEHAHGSAGDVPDMLRALADGDDDAWERIWSSLCHQGDVYPASYAALPHVVAIAAGQPFGAQVMSWVFAGAIAAASADEPDPVPRDLRAALDAAIADAVPRAVASLQSLPADHEHNADIWLAVAIAGLRRQDAIAAVIEGLVDGEQGVVCRQCSVYLTVGLDASPFRVTARSEAVVSNRPTQFAPPSRSVELEEIASTVERAGHPTLAARIRSLDDDVTCPACGVIFSLV